MKHPVLMSLSVLGLAWATVLMEASTVQAAEPAKLTAADADPPKDLADPIRGVLQPKAIRLEVKGKPAMEFWFRKEIPLAEKPAADALAPTVMKEGTLVGAVKVLVPRRDFKDDDIPPAVYVLRFGLQPEDGNHMGTSPTRTFLLLTPADKDRELEALHDHEALVKASSTVNTAKHPAILNLQPVQQADGDFPRLAAHNDGKHKVVYLRLPAKVEGQSEPAQLTLALVYEGKGEM